MYALLIACLGLSVYHFDRNLLNKFPRNPFVVNSNDFRAPWFTTFLCGSLLAFTYLTYENGISHFSLCKWILSTRLAQLLLNLTTALLIIYAFRSDYLSDNEGGEGRYLYWYKAAFFWSITIFLLLLSRNECNFGRMFFNMTLMRKFGIYSYGIYLWHPTAIKLTERIATMTTYDHIWPHLTSSDLIWLYLTILFYFFFNFLFFFI